MTTKARPHGIAPGSLYDLKDSQGRPWCCLVARVAKTGLLGYFFPGGLGTPQQPSQAVVVLRITPFGIRDGSWVPAGQLAGFKSDQWPVPVFYRFEQGEGHFREISYSDDLSFCSEREIPPRALDRLREDGLYGDIAVAKVLSMQSQSA